MHSNSTFTLKQCKSKNVRIYFLIPLQIFQWKFGRSDRHCNRWLAKHVFRKTWDWTQLLLLLKHITTTEKRSLWRSSETLLWQFLFGARNFGRWFQAFLHLQRSQRRIWWVFFLWIYHGLSAFTGLSQTFNNT